VVSLVVAAPAASEELGRVSLEVDDPAFCDARERIQVSMFGGCEVMLPLPQCIHCWFWDDIWLSTADIGTTLTVDQTYSCFPTLVAALTDDVGQNCGVKIWLENGYLAPGTRGCGIGVGGLEHDLFALDGNDFHGAIITSFSVRLDDLQFEDGSYPPLKRVSASLTWIVEGARNPTPVQSSTWGGIKALYR
jgi:hypothetical protein